MRAHARVGALVGACVRACLRECMRMEKETDRDSHAEQERAEGECAVKVGSEDISRNGTISMWDRVYSIWSLY